VLHISERTAANHVKTILDKRGMDSCAQIAAWIAGGSRTWLRPCVRAGRPRECFGHAGEFVFCSCDGFRDEWAGRIEAIRTAGRAQHCETTSGW